MRQRRSTLLLWFGITGGPLAWAVVHVIGYASGIAQCDDPARRWQVPVHAFDIAAAGAGFVIGVAALGVSLAIFLATRGVEDSSAPPQGRVHFLSVCGLVVNFLAIAIIVLDGVGSPLTGLCHQS